MTAVMATVTIGGHILSTCVRKGLKILLRAHDGRRDGRCHDARPNSFDLCKKGFKDFIKSS
jgi:hypothetical protein